MFEPYPSPAGEPPSPARPRRARRRRRALGFALAACLLLPLLAFLAGFVGLRSTAVRRVLLDRVAGYLAREHGLAFAAEDFDFRWEGVELEGVRVGAPGAAPLLTAERVVARVDSRTLRDPVLVVRSLALVGARLDLAAAFPELPAGEPEAPPGFEIRRFTLRRGAIAGAPVSGAAAEWVRSWQVERIEGEGSFTGGLWTLRLDGARGRVARPGFPPLALDLAGRARWADGRPLEIAALRLTGDGLRLAGSGRVGLGGNQATAVEFQVEAEPRLFAAGAPPGGSVRAAGALRLPEAAGRLALFARDVPAEALRPYLPPQLFVDLGVAGTAMDARSNLVLGPGSLARVAGEGNATWRRGKRRLLRASAGLEPGPEGAIRLVADADLLPESSGRRHVRGAVAAASLAALAEGTAERIDVELRAADARAAWEELRALWPRFVPAPPAGAPVQGAVAAGLRLTGPLAAPRAALDATWAPVAGSQVRVAAEGLPRAGSGSATVHFGGVPVALLGPLAGVPEGWAGALSGRADFSGTAAALATRVDATAIALSVPGSEVVAASAERLHVTLDGTLRLAPVSWSGTYALDAAGLDAPGEARAATLHAEGDLRFAGALSSLAGGTRMMATAVEVAAAGTTLDTLAVDAALAEGEVRLASFSAAAGERNVAGSGRVTIEPLLAEADLDLRLTRPIAAVREAELRIALRDGTLSLAAPRIDGAAGPASLDATIPLGAFRAVPQLAPALDALPFPPAEGPIALRLDAPALDSAPLLAALAMPPRPERVRAGLAADLTFDLAAPAAARGEVRIEELALATPDAAAAAEGPILVRLGGGRVELLPARLRFARGAAAGVGLEVRGAADFAPAWHPAEDPPAELVTRLGFAAAGSVAAALLNPYLSGGAGTGDLALTATLAGPPDALVARLDARGPEASFFWPAPYATRIERPQVELSLRDGRWTLDAGRAAWNGGALAVSGGGAPAGGAALEFDLSGVRYRLDYGLSALLAGRLALDLPAGGRPRLAGRITVERALLDRDLNLDRTLRDLLFAPDDLPGTEESALSSLDLDLRIETTDGLRVRNNVADLRAWWRSLAVSGTPEAPVVAGRIDLDPGGLLFAYGQTVRIDRGSLLFTGDPLTDPRVELSTTSSLEDPTIARLRGDDSPLAALDRPERAFGETGPGTDEVLTAGLAGHYGGRVLSRLGESVGLQRVALRPVLSQEVDPSARLEVGHDLSPNASFALSADLRNVERRTYLVDLHGFRELPGLALQGFVDDEGREGASLQQVLELGGSKPPPEAGLRLRRLRVEAPGGAFRRRALRRAVPLARGASVAESAPFDVEVVLADHLRRRGHPDPRVTATVAPVDGRPERVDVLVRVEPGPHATIEFAGDRPPAALRREIAALYRTDFYEPVSLEEMRLETVRALRGSGHLDPRVEVEVAPRAGGDRAVTVRGAAGPRAALRDLAIEGVDAAAAAAAARPFAGTLARAELAAGLLGAERRLLEALRAEGWPRPRVVGRRLERGGERLAVQVEPGGREIVAAVAVEGVAGAEAARLAALLPALPGEPARRDRIAAGARVLERALAAEGHPDAVARPSVHPGPPERPLAVEVRYAVAPGPRVALAGVEFEGGRWSRQERLERIAGLAPGGPFTAAGVEEARARLSESGAFTRVGAEVERSSDGAARVRFALAERPRFRLGYGLRWESEAGASAVVDAVDSNFLGRGLTLGLRGLYEQDDRSGRLFLRTGPFTRGGIALEAYAQERRRLAAENLLEESLETALQLARPLAARTTGRLYARYRTVRLFEEEPDPFFPLEVEITHPYAGTQLLYEGLDDPLDPAAGVFGSLDLSGSGPWSGSDFDYARAFGQLQLYRPLSAAGRRLVWAQSLRLGWARAFGGQELLRFERFFAGGAHSVRGYATESLGPREVLGDLVRPLGGEALLVVNQELRAPLPWDLTGLVFLDAGQVWADAADFGTDLAAAVGVGLRARTPIGLLRLDAAVPLDRRPGDDGYRLYLGFGNAF